MTKFQNVWHWASDNKLTSYDMVDMMNNGLGGSAGALASEIMTTFEGYDDRMFNASDVEWVAKARAFHDRIESEIIQYLDQHYMYQDEYGEWVDTSYGEDEDEDEEWD